MTIWQQLVTAVNVRLATITIINGYSADLGASIHWNPDEDLHPDQLPALVLADSIQAVAVPGVSGRFDNTLQIEIEIQAKGKNAADAVREMAQDILTAIAEDPTWGDLAADSTIDGVAMEVEDKGKRFAAAGMSLTIKYRASAWSI